MQHHNENNASKRNRVIAILVGIFMGVLLLLTLFSNTIQTATLPKVSTERAVKKALSNSVEGQGVIVPKMMKELSSDSGWRIAAINVRDHDTVKKGQVLITFDSTEAEQQLLDAEDQLKKQNLNRELLKEQFVAAQRSGNEEEIRKAKRGLEIDQVDREMAQRKIEIMKKDIARKQAIIAPFDGKVEEIKVEKGENTSPGQLLLSLVNRKEGFQITFGTNGDAAALLQIGDKVDIEIKGNKAQRLKGAIADIQSGPPASSGEKESRTGGGTDGKGTLTQSSIKVDVSGGKLQGGEQAIVKAMKKAKEQGLVIRKDLLKKDGNGSYLFIVHANRSPLGNTYIVQKAYVQTGEENEDEIMILDGLSPGEDIIVDSSDPLQDGNRIRLN